MTYYQKHKETMIKNARKWHFTNPLKRAKIMQTLHYRNKYGITIEDYNQMFAKQNGRCAVCEKHQSELKRCLDIDHNHKTDKIRGLVCIGCNRLIGKYENKQLKAEKFIQKVKNYLVKF